MNLTFNHMGTIMNLRKKVILPTTKQDCVIAVSGGVDSMCLLHYMKDHNNVTAVHIHHNSNSDDDTSLKIVENYCTKHNIKLDVFKISEKIESNFECQAREFRHSIFKQYKEPVYLGHTLDDQVEEYLMSNIKGRLRIINAVNGNIRRPYLLLKKKELYEYAAEHGIEYLDESTKFDGSNKRSYCRNFIMPHALVINPGLYKTVARISQEYFTRKGYL